MTRSEIRLLRTENRGYHQDNVLVRLCKRVGLGMTWPTSPDTEEGDE